MNNTNWTQTRKEAREYAQKASTQQITTAVFRRTLTDTERDIYREGLKHGYQEATRHLTTLHTTEPK